MTITNEILFSKCSDDSGLYTMFYARYFDKLIQLWVIQLQKKAEQH